MYVMYGNACLSNLGGFVAPSAVKRKRLAGH